jgi:hypothetical protein
MADMERPGAILRQSLVGYRNAVEFAVGHISPRDASLRSRVIQ